MGTRHADGVMREDAAMKNIRWGRAVIAGLAANVASFILGGGGYVLVGRHVWALEPASIWRWTPLRMFDLPAGWWVYLVNRCTHPPNGM